MSLKEWSVDLENGIADSRTSLLSGIDREFNELHELLKEDGERLVKELGDKVDSVNEHSASLLGDLEGQVEEGVEKRKTAEPVCAGTA